jgi:hypothetical protein
MTSESKRRLVEIIDVLAEGAGKNSEIEIGRRLVFEGE